MPIDNGPIDYRISPPVGDVDLNHLFASAWDGHTETPFAHVDDEPHLDGFYRGCGFVPCAAGLLRLPNR